MHRDYICAANHTPMSAPGPRGQERIWILEVHLIHSSGRWGGFYEDLLLPNY